ncbi:MAG: glucose-1-phosphate adenylyltransferase [Cardiobacteriaceae bacterium]|nr:glucose-1-phosphate adenylyltransferase [Cardiobacteriaceae bacterium]
MKQSKKTSEDETKLAEETLALVLAGGRGSRLYELTDNRAKPAVYFGGNRRIIDFALSNCVNSNILKIGVVTQYAAHSLLRHLQRGWSFLPYERNQYIDMLPARQQIDEHTWYRGTADSVYQNMRIMKSHYRCKYVLILAGDHIYKMDYRKMLADHSMTGAKCTVACIEVPKQEAGEFGIMDVNDQLNVVGFVEKPKDPPTIPGRPNYSLASMGIYVFNADYLYEILEKEATSTDTDHDFGKNIIPKAVQDGVVYAHPFERSCRGRTHDGLVYWRDVGTLDAYWGAHMDLCSEHPQLNLYDESWLILGRPQQTWPTRFFYKTPRDRTLDNSLVSGGSVIEDAEISHSVIFPRCKIKENSVIESTVMLPDCFVGKNCVIRNAILDRYCEVPDGLQIGVNAEFDQAHFRVSKQGIVLVNQAMLENITAERNAHSGEE